MAAPPNTQKLPRTHLVVGGFPAGAHAGHDMDYARLQLLNALYKNSEVTVADDFANIVGHLKGDTKLLVTYTAGPTPDDAQTAAMKDWLEAGGRWISFHGSSGGKAEKPRPGEKHRRMVRMPVHEIMGNQFLNHPPMRKVQVTRHSAAPQNHPLLSGVPDSFEVEDEPYLVKLTDPANTTVLLTTKITDDQARTPRVHGRGSAGNGGSDMLYDDHPALEGPSGDTVTVAYEKKQGKGGVVYIALGHCHSQAQRGQMFEGPWAVDGFKTLLSNTIKWGLDGGASSKL